MKSTTNSIASSINPASVAAMGVGVRYEMLPYIISMGISIAASAVVGQGKGADDPGRIKTASFYSLKLILYFSLIIGGLFFVFARPLSSIFLSGEAVDISAMYLRVSPFSRILFYLAIVFEGIFIGMGLTAIPLGLALIIILLRIPLSHIFRSLLWVFMVFPLTDFSIVAFFVIYLKISLERIAKSQS